MTLDEQLKFCRICLKRKLNPAIGLVCSLTSQKPSFAEICSNFDVDEPEAQRLITLEKEAAQEETSGFFTQEQKGIQKGVLGGAIMIAIALIWFVVGLFAGYIYFYPPVLFIFGVYALVKGITKGNLKGEKAN
jgi:hypothetical protein